MCDCEKLASFLLSLASWRPFDRAFWESREVVIAERSKRKGSRTFLSSGWA